MFKDQTSKPRPTPALEYKFTRSSVGIQSDKDVSHFWEIGGGRLFVETLNTALTAENFEQCICVVALDLSRPGDIPSEAEFWLKRIQSRAQECVRESPKAGKTSGRLQDSAVAILMVGTKYDELEKVDVTHAKAVNHGLRALAHQYGASLVYTSVFHKKTMSLFRTYISRHIMGKKFPSTKNDKDGAALVIPAGTDTTRGIGEAKRRGAPLGARSSRSPLRSWLDAMSSYFPPTEQGDLKAKLAQPKLAPEPLIDETLERKEGEMARLRHQRDLERKMEKKAKR